MLRQRGITPKSIAYLRFLGDENSFTTDRVAVDTNDIEWIWGRMIETAEPYVYWESSGYRRIEIYTHGHSQPAAVLLVNDTDATSIYGARRSFMCYGLHDVAMQLLGGPTGTNGP